MPAGFAASELACGVEGCDSPVCTFAFCSGCVLIAVCAVAIFVVDTCDVFCGSPDFDIISPMEMPTPTANTVWQKLIEVLCSKELKE